MDQEIGKRWIAALESGEYMKGKGRLCAERSTGHTVFCCLGVLCELALKDGVDLVKEWSLAGATYDGEGSFLPGSVVDWAGMHSSNGEFCDSDEEDTLVGLNDDSDAFEPVIEIIRNHLEEL